MWSPNWSPKEIKSYCQYTAYVYIICGFLFSKINPSEASALFTGLVLLFAVMRNNHLMLVLFQYFAITDLAICLSGLAGDIQKGQIIFTGQENTIRWLLAFFTLITRIWGMILGYKLYQHVKASKHGYLDPEELNTGPMFGYQQANTPETIVNDSSMNMSRAEFKPFGGRGITISA